MKVKKIEESGEALMDTKEATAKIKERYTMMRSIYLLGKYGNHRVKLWKNRRRQVETRDRATQAILISLTTLIIK
jgi:hypothetical protein